MRFGLRLDGFGSGIYGNVNGSRCVVYGLLCNLCRRLRNPLSFLCLRTGLLIGGLFLSDGKGCLSGCCLLFGFLHIAHQSRSPVATMLANPAGSSVSVISS